MASRITFLGSMEDELRAWLTGHPANHERGAFVLFRKFDRYSENKFESPRFVATDIVIMDDDWVLDSSPSHLRINMRKLPDLYLRCELENLELGFVHSHPNGTAGFSTQDDQNEQNILQGYAGCNGNQVTLIALVLCDGQWIARTRAGSDREVGNSVRHVSVVSDKLDIHLRANGGENSEHFLRQEAAFGKPFNKKLKSIRAVVVGAGGTGSSLITMLARAGVGELIIIDGDKLEDSNLNRVRGYKKSDVGNNKATTLASFISSLGLDTNVIAIPEFLHLSPRALDALTSADVIFGCTDDVTGRDLLNQAAYYYALPLFDLGLTGRVDKDEFGDPFLSDHRGRISLVLPEHGKCLRCQEIVTDEKLAFEDAVRLRPELKDFDKETLKKEFYLTGGSEQAPGVGPFTSMTADMAVSAFMNLIKPFWKIPTDLRVDNIWIDFVHMYIHSNSRPENPECFCCGNTSIRLKRENGYRLDMPALGRIGEL